MTVKRRYPELSRPELTDAVMYAMRDMSGASVFFHTAIAERLGLNATDHKCADLIHRRGLNTASALAEATGLTTGAITGVIDRLEKAGIVRRDPDPNDRRRTLLTCVPSPEMSKRMWELFAPIAEATVELMKDYSDEELAVVLDVMIRAQDITRAAALKVRAGAS